MQDSSCVPLGAPVHAGEEDAIKEKNGNKGNRYYSSTLGRSLHCGMC